MLWLLGFTSRQGSNIKLCAMNKNILLCMKHINIVFSFQRKNLSLCMNHKTLCIVFVFKEHCDQNAFQFTVTAPCIRSNHCARAYLQKKEEKEETSSKSWNCGRSYLQNNREKEKSWKILDDAIATFCHKVASGQQWINMWQISHQAITETFNIALLRLCV